MNPSGFSGHWPQMPKSQLAASANGSKRQELRLDHRSEFRLWWAKAAKWQAQGLSLREIKHRLKVESKGKIQPEPDEISRNIGKFRREAWPGVAIAYRLVYRLSGYPGVGTPGLPKGPEAVRRTRRTKALLQLDGFEPHIKQSARPGYTRERAKWSDGRYHWKRILDGQRAKEMQNFFHTLDEKSATVAAAARQHHVRKEYAFGIRREPWLYAGYCYLSREVVKDLNKDEPSLRKRLQNQIPALNSKFVWVKADHPALIEEELARRIQKAPGRFRFGESPSERVKASQQLLEVPA
jgi:hypothetical protein